MVSSVMSSLYEMELENIKERTMVGRMVYTQQGGKLGRPNGTTEQYIDFLNKPASKEILKYLDKGMTIREISKIVASCGRFDIQYPGFQRCLPWGVNEFFSKVAFWRMQNIKRCLNAHGIMYWLIVELRIWRQAITCQTSKVF
jgi:hypothetical protein